MTPGDEINRPANTSGSICLVDDHQIRVTANNLERYHRRASKVVTAAGLNDLSQLELDFEPSYQKLAIHYIRIHRGNQVIAALKPDEVKVVQKEEELDQALYNGTLSAVVFVNDVRVGDIVDYAYSIRGGNPVLKGQYADSYPLALGIPTEKVRWRLLWPSSRKLLYRTRNIDLQPSQKESPGHIEYLWEQNHVSEVEPVDATPSWFSPVPFVQVSEFEDWGAVVRWALPLYEVRGPLATGLATQLDRWRAKGEDPGRRMIVALRFLQDEIRYTGIELGPYSHTPTQPNVVFLRRFGDCKDKSLLLCTMLRALDIDANPALVDTELRGTIEEDQPSPFMFNHVIVRASIAGKVYWLDPTIGFQRGDLAHHTNPDYGRALVIRAGEQKLEEIPNVESETPTTEVKETYTASSYEGSSRLDVVTTYRQADADLMRYQVSQRTLSEIAKTYLTYYAQVDPSIQPVGSIEIDDDQDSNTIRLIERYQIPDFWRAPRREFYAGLIWDCLGKLPASNRKTPFALSRSKYFTETIEARLPEHYEISGGSGTIGTKQLGFRYSLASTGATLTLSYQLRQHADHVPVTDLAAHSDAIARIQNVLGLVITRDAESAPGYSGSLLGMVPILIVVSAFAVFGAMKLLGRRRQAPQPERAGGFRVSRGETPGAAIPVNSSDEFAAHLVAFRCACGHGYHASELPAEHDSLTFDGRRISVVSLTCGRCARTRDVYFAMSTARDR